MSLEEQKQLESEYVMGTFARKPVCLVEGRGMHVADDAGRDYLDFIGGIGVCSLGHCHPAVVAAVQEQAGKLMHVSNYYYIEKRGEVARLLSDALNYVPAGESASAEQWKTFFANSGAEANECMMKLARLYARVKGNGGTTIVTLDGSFHGRTMETLAATAQPAKQESFQPLPGGFVHVKPNDEQALRAMFDQLGSEICAFMFEPIRGESGVHPCEPEYLQVAQELCHEVGALMIADEVQTGVYRTGTPFAFQQMGIQPDIVSIAKGIADGFPMGACAARAQVADAFNPGDHGSTFGGSNLAIAAACATLSELAAGAFTESVPRVGAYLKERLAQLPAVTQVRGRGLMVACDIAQPLEAPAVVQSGLAQGLLLNATGPHTLRFLPPLVCSEQEIDTLMEKLGVIMQICG
ncbi:MAG: acetylornithine/succinylornithine family transaminase [Eggerthellaceae bacterium]|nr:acetylornithine/succinylornithine family transaminase [Eggerthellaceae bacterium]